MLPQVDKDGANPDRVMQELSSVGLMPEDWGGNVPMVQVILSVLQHAVILSYLQDANRVLIPSSFLLQISALKGENVDELLETVMLVAEVRANPLFSCSLAVICAFFLWVAFMVFPSFIPF